MSDPATRALMSAWYRNRTSTFEGIPRPPIRDRVSASGVNPLSVLLVGSGPGVGWGVRTHDLALGGQLARALARRTMRGVDVVIQTDPMGNLLEPGFESRRPIADFDVVVVTSGIEDACSLLDPSAWETKVRALVDDLQARVSASAIVLITGIPPISAISELASPIGRVAERHAGKLDARTADVCRTFERVEFVPLSVPSGHVAGRHRSPREFQDWADAIALPLVVTLMQDGKGGSARRVPEVREQVRQQAVDELDLPAMRSSPALEHIVALARRAFGAATATISIIDGDRQIYAATSGVQLEEISRDIAFCDLTIRDPAGMIVPDASRDPRFASNPLVASGGIGFYAGFPIATPEGLRVGALCVIDPLPRQAGDVSAAALRDLALLVEGEVARISAVRAA